jgi:hypothetical protein
VLASFLQTRQVDGVSQAVLGTNVASQVGDGASASGELSAALGAQSLASEFGSVAVGNGAQANSQYSTAVGRNSSVNKTGGTALGQHSYVAGLNSIVVGSKSAAKHADVVIIGNGLVSTQSGQVKIGPSLIGDSHGLIGTSFRTAASGARIEVDATNGLVAYNSAGAITLQADLSGNVFFRSLDGINIPLANGNNSIAGYNSLSLASLNNHAEIDISGVAGDNIWLFVPTGQKVSFNVNNVEVAYLDGSGLHMVGGMFPAHMADGSAANDTIYYSTTASKLVYKDSGGTVNNLY